MSQRFMAPALLGISLLLSACGGSNDRSPVWPFIPLPGTAAPPTAAQSQKNILFFLGDGMGITTMTAARIYKVGEDGDLTMDTLPETAFVHTYSNDAQVTGSAPSMSAYMTGVKMNNEVISMSPETKAADASGKAYQVNFDSTCPSGNGQAVETLLEQSKAKGYATGVVTTTRITHATPAATYSRVCHRDAENTIAAALVPGGAGYNGKLGDGVDVFFGGGTDYFTAKEAGGKRNDKRDLIAELKTANYSFVADKAEFDKLPADGTTKIAGLFTKSHMAYDLDRVATKEPSLAEMTGKAIDALAARKKGFFLMVEGGRIDHALHGTNAKRALEDTLAFDAAIQTALDYMEKKAPGSKNTLVVITADHDHAIAFNGYPKIGNPILGKVNSYSDGKLAKAADDKPYTTLVFGNGDRPNATGSSPVNAEDGNKPWIAPARAASRDDQTAMDTEDDNFLQEVGINLGTPGAETHGGGDVMLFAGGAGSKIFKGTVENIKVFDKVKEAAGL